jgi:hypothetical protein
MTAYFMQELILEPYAGLVFHFTPGQSTSLSGAQNGGVFVGMLAVGIAATGLGLGSLRAWAIAGCLGSAAALLGIALIGPLGMEALVPLTILLGLFNGMFAVAAIGAMMALAGQGRAGREGTRMGIWGAAQAIAAGAGGLLGAVAVDVLRLTLATDIAFATVFAAEAALFLVAAVLRTGHRPRSQPSPHRHPDTGRMSMKFDVIVVGGGPSGATAAEDLARGGASVALLDRAGRIKPCGGAVPPRLIQDFAIPDSQIVARIKTARMISPTGRSVDIAIENGYVGMVDREHFDDFLRRRAVKAGATLHEGTFTAIERDEAGTHVIYRDKRSGDAKRVTARLIIGADGARSNVARAEVPGGDTIPYVIAYHEIIEAPLPPPPITTPPAAT